MKVTRFAAFAALSLVSLSATAFAGPMTPKTLEFSPTLAFNRSSYSQITGGTGTATNLNLSAALSRTMTQRFQAQGALLLQHRDLAGDGHTAYGASVGGQWNFPGQTNVVPFLSANVGAIQYRSAGATDKALLAPILRVGFRSMLDDAHSMNVSVGYQHESNSVSTFEKDSNTWDVGIGVSLFRAH